MLKLWILLLSAICSVKSTNAANILIIQPFGSKSHDNFHTAIAKSLLSAGHHVTAISMFPKSVKHSNFSAINCGEHEESPVVTNIMSVGDALKMSNNMIKLSIFGLEMHQQECRKIFKLDEMKKIMKSEEKLFDIILLDVVFGLAECFLPIAEKCDIPVIGTVTPRSWVKAEWMMGNPYNPSVTPTETSLYSYPMTFMQRLDNTWACLLSMMFYRYYTLPELQKFYQELFPHLNYADRRKVSLLFVNNHPVLSTRPVLPTVIDVGGLHVPSAKPLPENLQTFINGAEHGAILFSIGSFLQSYNMPAEILSILRETFAQIPQRVIWKAEEPIEGVSKNVMVSKWLPQRDILAHKNVVAFISHCGISGIYEGLYSGVPMVLLPIFADQISNAAVLQRLEYGPKLDITKLTKEELLQALNDVINGTRYRKRVKEIHSLIKDQPMSPQETAVYWIEYVIRHKGASHLQSAALEMPLYQYLLLDVVGLILLMMISIFTVLYYILFYIYKNYIRKKNVKIKRK